MSTAVSAERLNEKAAQVKESRLAELESNVQRLTDKVDAHVMAYGFDRTTFYEQHSSVSEKLRGLEAKMTGMEAIMTAAEAKMTDVEGKMESLVGRVEELERPWYRPRAKKTNEERLGVLLADLEKLGGGAGAEA
jgi:chromosome segregation ATPase